MSAGARTRARVRKDRSDFAIAIPYQAPGLIQQWLCQDTVSELRGWTPRIIPARERPAGVALTWLDGMAGGGGATKGIFDVPGNAVTIVQNHWPLAVETHNANFPDTDHDVANVARVDPRRYPTTDCAWFSPECTKWSIAAGRPCDFDTDWEQLSLFGEEEDEEPASKEARWRSRLLMTDVIRFARVHHYKAIIVENVPDILKWHNFSRWVRELENEDYRVKVITLNSAFAGAFGESAPQLRDRVFIACWKRRYPTPNWDKWLRPLCWCPRCEQVVRGRFTAKPTDDPSPWRPMRYNAQYFYRCPNHGTGIVRSQPYVLPARAAVDVNKVGQRIGDRSRPLAPKTRDRVAAGLIREAQRAARRAQILAEVAGHTFERRPGVRTRSADAPMTTLHTTASKALATAPMLVPTGGTWREDATTVDLPMATRTTRENDALLTPPPFLTVLRSDRPRTIGTDEPLATVVADGSGHALIVPTEGRDGIRARGIDEPLRTQTGRHLDALVVPLRNNGVARPAGEHPIPTVAAGGEHIALVMRNYTPRGDTGQMTTPVDEPVRTLTGSGGQSLVVAPLAFVMRNNQGGAEMSTPVGEPLRTLTTAGHQSLVNVGDPALFGYDTGLLRPLDEPMPTQTTVEGDALLHTAVDVDNCYIRMLDVDEIRGGMAFPAGYILLGNAKRDKVRMLGNAVTPPCARDLVACVTEAILGEDYDLAVTA